TSRHGSLRHRRPRRPSDSYVELGSARSTHLLTRSVRPSVNAAALPGQAPASLRGAGATVPSDQERDGDREPVKPRGAGQIWPAKWPMTHRGNEKHLQIVLWTPPSHGGGTGSNPVCASSSPASAGLSLFFLRG